MIIGVPKETKQEEYRVSMTPGGVGEMRRDGHRVLIEPGAGEGSGFSDEEYLSAGGDITGRADLFGKSDLIVKVKEPLPSEFGVIRDGQALFAYLHLAPNPLLTKMLLEKGVTAFGYETLEKDGTLPLLIPMSEIAGRIAPIAGSYHLQKLHGGKGILSTGATGVRPGKAVILGAGIVGTNAARVCVGLHMDTVVLNRGLEGLKRIDDIFRGEARTLPLTLHNVSAEIVNADLIVGALLIPGGKTPVVITREMLRTMERGTVIVDVSIDQGGCVETSRPTTHDNPTYEVDGIVHYAVSNMPGAYPRTSTLALTNATLPYVKTLAQRGVEGAIVQDEVLRSSLNTYRGYIVHQALAQSAGLEYRPVDQLIQP